MRKERVLHVATALAAITLLLIGCGPKQRAAQGMLDTPESHYHQGVRLLDEGDLMDAAHQFEDAILLDAKYAPAYAGQCLVNASQGAKIADPKSNERKEYFKKAQKSLSKAKGLDDKNPAVWIAHIRLYSMWQEDSDWLKDCEKGFKKALKLDPQSDEAYYFMGLAYRSAFAFRKSEEMLRSALEIDGNWSEKAGQALQAVHKIVEAQPGTKYGKIIALADEITRADMAVLFIEELNIAQRISRRELATQMFDLSFKSASAESSQPASMPPAINDISGHWAESMIRDFVDAGLFDVMPDGGFHPNEAVTRIEFAGVVQRLLYQATRDPSLFSKYMGEQESHIRDMRTDHPFYGAAMICVERDIMDLDKVNGFFHPQEHIGGPDALLFIRDLKNALKW